MPPPISLVAPEAARAFLAAINAQSARRGEAYLDENRVNGITCLQPGTAYSIKVHGTFSYEVSFCYDPDTGWDAECSCPVGCDCKHIYAAVKTLLARSGGAAAPGTDVPAPPPPSEGLAAKVQAALERPLKPQESGYLRKLREAFRRVATSRQIGYWDLETLGLTGLGWNAPQLWPSLPKDEHEFWLYIAFALRERKLPLPEFLRPVTDLKPIEERIRRWRRGQEVDRWRQVLKNRWAFATAAEPERSGTTCDLRVLMEDSSAVLAWQRPGQDAFTPMKQSQFRDLAVKFDGGAVEFVPEAEAIWQVFHSKDHYRSSPHRLDYRDIGQLQQLGRLLRRPNLASRIITEDGQPLERPAERLRWEVTEPSEADGDYGLRVVTADGCPVPVLRCVLPGQPALYLTAGAVYTGPPVPQGMLDPARPNLIPARALETGDGLALLQGLRVELPARLRAKVREVSMALHLRCELRLPNQFSRSEYCLVRGEARADDGSLVEQWNGVAWHTATETKPAKGTSGALVIYDRSKLPNISNLLEPLALKWDNYQQILAVRVTREFPAAFAAWLKSLPPDIKIELDSDLATLAQEPVAGSVRLEAAEAAIDWFDLQVVLDVNDTQLTPDELKLLLNAKGKFVRLEGKGWRRLAFNLSPEEDERLARLGLSPANFTSEPQRLHALQLADDAARKFLPAEQAERIRRRADEIKARVTPAVPGAISATLRPYQNEGFHFLAYLATNRFGGILADDMGLGKTLQTLAWLSWLRAPADPAAPAPPPTPTADAPTLVVCPKSVMNNWSAEAARFASGLRVKTWPAGELPEFANRLHEADLHVLNYSQLRLLGESLVSVQWRAVILDEGQYIKNPNSQTAQIARALRAEHRLVLTGTPIENRLLDLWSLMAFAMPGALGSRAQFARAYDVKDDPLARRRLAARVRPFLLRRTKTQVAKDLPDRIEEDLHCEIEGEQQTLYRAELKRAQQMLLKVTTQKQLNKERFHFLTSLLRLRQVCCHPALVKANSKAESAKLEALLEQLEPLLEEGHKALVFSQFVEMLELIRPAIEKRGWKHFYLCGDTENRGELIEKFQATEGAAVFLLSLKAGGFGLNLTAASYVFLFDPWWNPAVENQAIDRTHRIGQTRKVIAYRLLIKDSIEEKIRALQKQKKALAEDVLGEEKFAQALTLADLRYLFAD